jgi:hypothetical protein
MSHDSEQQFSASVQHLGTACRKHSRFIRTNWRPGRLAADGYKWEAYSTIDHVLQICSCSERRSTPINNRRGGQRHPRRQRMVLARLRQPPGKLREESMGRVEQCKHACGSQNQPHVHCVHDGWCWMGGRFSLTTEADKFQVQLPGPGPVPVLISSSSRVSLSWSELSSSAFPPTM